MRGNEVATLVNGQLKKGNYKIQWIPGKLPAGSYFYKLLSGRFESKGKMILIK
jgi:hypothetical protein